MSEHLIDMIADTLSGLTCIVTDYIRFNKPKKEEKRKVTKPYKARFFRK